MLGPSAHDTLCAPSKNRVSVSSSPVVLQHCWYSKLNALGILPCDARPSDSLGGLLWESSSVACEGLIFFGEKAVSCIDVFHLFPQCMLAAIPLIGDMNDIVVTRACTGY